MADFDHTARMRAELVRQLKPHSIGADRLAVEYQDDWQDYDVLIDGGELTGEQIAGIREAVRMGGCVRFSDTRNTDRWDQILRWEGAQILKAQAAEARLEYPDIPRFDRSADTLTGFVRSLEIWAGAEPGSTLTVLDDRTVQVEFRGAVPNFARIQKHLVVTAILTDEDIEVRQLIGMDSGGD